MLVRLAWRNIWRNPRRTGVVLSAIAVGIGGCLFTVAINVGMIAGMVDVAIRSGLGHVQVHAEGWDESPGLEVRLTEGTRSVAAALDAVPEVRAWAPRLRAQGLLASPRASVGVQIMGVDPAREAAVSIASDSVIEGQWLGQPRRVVVGSKLAKRLESGLGGKVVVSVQDLAGELTGQAFRIGGVIQAGSPDLDEQAVFLRIEEAQSLLGMGEAVSEIVVVTADRREVDAVQGQLAARLGGGAEVRTWEQLQPLLVYMVDTMDSTGWILYAAVFTAMAFGIANVLLMAVFERTREIGMMRAVGMSRPRVVGMVVLESTFVTALGLALGIGLAVLGVLALGDGIDISSFATSIDDYGVEPVIRPVLRPTDLVDPVAIGVIAALLSSLWPALRAARARPADALRRI